MAYNKKSFNLDSFLRAKHGQPPKKDPSAIYEVTDEQAAALQKEIDEEKNKKNTAQTTPDTEASQPQSDGAAEKAPKKRKTKKLKLGLNEGNGANRETYTWTQILTEVEVRVPLPTTVRGNDVVVKVGKKKLLIGIKGQTPIIDGDLHKETEFDDENESTHTWQLEDGNTIVVNMEKDRSGWWTQLLKGEPTIKPIIPKYTDSDMDSFMR